MDVTCLVDDAVKRSSSLWGEHGLAFLIDTGDRRVLFDTGQSGTVLRHNMNALNIEPDTIDAVALSHGHYDHTDGLFSLLGDLRPDVPLYAHPHLFQERYSEHHDRLDRVGLGSQARAGKSAAEVKEVLGATMALALRRAKQEILPGVWTTGEISDRPEREGSSSRHRMWEGGEVVPDRYVDDMSLVLSMDGGLLLLCGCCHAGLLNTLLHVERLFGQPVEMIAGGLHLTAFCSDELDHVCQVLKERPALRRVYPNHCTGEAAFVALTNALGSSVVGPCPAGTTLGL